MDVEQMDMKETNIYKGYCEKEHIWRSGGGP